MSFSIMTPSSTPLLAKIPPCISGLRVLTRPAIISGKPVKSDTSITGIPCSLRSFAVPPVERSSILRDTRL